MAGYQVKVTLEGTKPPVWRRLVIPDCITFAKLHQILQVAFGWSDSHLHEFELRETQECIGDPEECDDTDYDEKKLLVDDALKEGWIRYTYDFGDDWRHKILLEKELPEYGQRYPQVVKYKGENFAEDSGGVWARYEDEDEDEYGFEIEPFDLETVNGRLKEKCICKISSKHKTIGQMRGLEGHPGQDLRAQLDDLRKLMDAMDKMVAMGKMQQKPPELSQQEQRFKRVQEFLKRQPAVRNKAQREDTYSQLAFDWKRPGNLKEEPMASEAQAQPGSIQDKKRKQTISWFLRLCGQQHLRNYLKYMRCPAEKSWTVARLANEVAKCLKEHPEYLSLILKEEEAKWYVKYHKESGLPDRLDEETLAATSMLGLVDVQVVTEGGRERLTVTFPDDAAVVADGLKGELAAGRFQAVARTWERIFALLQCYAVIETDAMYQKYVRAFGSISQEEFERYLYLHGRMRGKVVTGNTMTIRGEVSWVALDKEYAVRTMKLQGKYAQDLPYADFTKKQINSMKNGFDVLYPQWGALAKLLYPQLRDKREMPEVLNELVERTVCGYSLDYLYDSVASHMPAAPDTWWGRLRKTLQECWLDTGIAPLKGFSRNQVGKLKGVEPMEVLADVGDEVDGEGDADAVEDLLARMGLKGKSK